MGLFMLAYIQRLLAAARAMLEQNWREQSYLDATTVIPVIKSSDNNGLPSPSSVSSLSSQDEKPGSSTSQTVAQLNDNNQKSPAPALAIRRLAPLFNFGRESCRAVLQMLQAFIGYLLMLAVSSKSPRVLVQTDCWIDLLRHRS